MNADERRDDLVRWGCNQTGHVLQNLATGMFVIIDDEGSARWMQGRQFREFMRGSARLSNGRGCTASNEVPASRSQQDRILADFALSAADAVTELVEEQGRQGLLPGRDYQVAKSVNRDGAHLWFQCWLERHGF